MRTTRAKSIGGGLLLALLAACASAGTSSDANGVGASSGAAGASVVVVRNIGPGSVNVTAFMRPTGGRDQPLGVVTAGTEGRFPFTGSSGTYRIRVVGSNGEQLSEEFQFYQNAEALWDLQTSARVRVRGL